jgi:hypothetical protein
MTVPKNAKGCAHCSALKATFEADAFLERMLKEKVILYAAYLKACDGLYDARAAIQHMPCKKVSDASH